MCLLSTGDTRSVVQVFILLLFALPFRCSIHRPLLHPKLHNTGALLLADQISQLLELAQREIISLRVRELRPLNSRDLRG